MASEQMQMPHRENNDTIMTGEAHVEKQRKENAAAGREGETRELGTHLESLADKVRDEREGEEKEQEIELHADTARSANVARDKEAEEAKREREGGGGGGYVGRFEIKGEGKGSGEEAKGLRDGAETERTTVEKERRGQVEAEEARTKEDTRETQAIHIQRAETQGPTKEVGGSEGQERGREEEDERSRLEEISKYIAQAQQKTMDAIASAQERSKRAKQEASEELSGAAAADTAKEHTARKKEEVERELEAQNQESKERPSEKNTTESCEKGERREQEQERKRESGAVSQTIGQVPQRATMPQFESNTVEGVPKRNKGVFGETKIQHAEKMNTTGEAIQQLGGSEGQERGREEDERSRLEEISKYRAHAQQKSMDAIASAQESYERAKQAANEALSGAAAADAAKEYTARKKEEAERELEAQNQESKERPISAKTTTESFERGERQEQEQERKREPGAVGQAVGQAPQRATMPQFESNTVEGVPKRNQGVFGETKIQHAEKMNTTGESLQGQEGKGSNVFTTDEDAVKDNAAGRVAAGKGFEGGQEQTQGRRMEGSAVQMVKKPLDNAIKGGSEALGAVGETVADIGETMMKPAEKVKQKAEETKGGGVLGAIGETIAEIAQTTKVLAVGEGETESSQSNVGLETETISISYEYKLE